MWRYCSRFLNSYGNHKMGLGGLIRECLDLLLPNTCTLCGEITGQLCCRTCFQHIPIAISTERQLLGIDSVITLCEYTEEMRQLLTYIKFDRNRLLAQEVACYLATIVKIWPWHGALFIPVPISKQRYRKRGFNHVDLLFSEIVSQFSLDYGPVIMRDVDTPALFGRSRDEREQLLQGAFSCPDDGVRVQGRHVVIGDDILTSGATLRELAQVCHAYGATSVSALCIAEVYDDLY